MATAAPTTRRARRAGPGGATMPTPSSPADRIHKPFPQSRIGSEFMNGWSISQPARAAVSANDTVMIIATTTAVVGLVVVVRRASCRPLGPLSCAGGRECDVSVGVDVSVGDLRDHVHTAAEVDRTGGGDLESVVEGDHRVIVDERPTRSDGISRSCLLYTSDAADEL